MIEASRIAVDGESTSPTITGSGANTPCYSAQTKAIPGNLWRGQIDASGHPGAVSVGLVAFAAPSSGLFLAGGEALVDLGTARLFQVILPTAGGVTDIKAIVKCDPSLNGATAFTQAFILGGGWELCNALDIRVGFY